MECLTMMQQYILALTLVSLNTVAVQPEKHGPHDDDHSSERNWLRARNKVNRNKRSSKPNIVFIITDDQDSELGSMNFMPKTLKILQEGGATFTNAFVTTPMCCPSRSSMLTGMYVHNHNVYTNNANCSSVQWQQYYENRNFGTYLTNAGYRTGYFGKYLNEYEGTHIPPGWTEWVGLVRNTRFYNYSVNFNGQKVRHFDDYHKDYLTDLIANDSVTFLKQSKQYFPNRPVAMVLSMPAPHGPEDAAPQYQHMFMNVTTHRTPSYNFAPNPDKQWLLQYSGKMEPIHTAFTDLLHTKRLQTLQSVDDAVQKVYDELKQLGELDNTYIVYSSDHGYHLGQYGIVKGKAMPYDFDVRVPFYVRGPNVPQGVKVPGIVLNIDLAPTFLDIAQVPVPDHMDGRSFLKLFEGADLSQDGIIKVKKAWRDSFLIERGKITHKKKLNRERLEAQKNTLQVVVTKEQRLEEECQKAEYQPPCSPLQEWVCNMDLTGKFRMYKCRTKDRHNHAVAPLLPVAKPMSQPMMAADAPMLQKQVSEGMCVCPWQENMDLIDKDEKQRQRHFLRHHVNKPKSLQAKFIKRKDKRNSRKRRHLNSGHSYQTYAKQSRLQYNTEERKRNESSEASVTKTKIYKTSGGVPVSCRVLPNDTVMCERSVYADFDSWKMQKHNVDNMIHEYKERLDALKDVRRHLKKQRPLTIPPIDDWQDSNIDTSNPIYQDPFSGHTYGSYEDIEGTDSTESTRSTNTLDYFDEEKQVANYLGQVHVDEAGQEWCPCHMFSSDNNDQPTTDHSEDISLTSGENRKKKKFLKREKKRKERERIREEKREERQKKKIQEFPDDLHPMAINPTRDCNSPKMKCFTQDNEHWETPPLWTLGPFCFCPNSNNNTYWCLRTINITHNFLYCEFITGFISYYDMMRDPYQLRNAVHDLSYNVLQGLSNTLDRLKSCKGNRECTIRTRPTSGGLVGEEDHRQNTESVGLPDEKEVDEGIEVSSGEVDTMVLFDSASGDESNVPQPDLLLPVYDPEKEKFLWWTNVLRLDKKVNHPAN